jgi:hypothetical protein
VGEGWVRRGSRRWVDVGVEAVQGAEAADRRKP